MNIALALVAGVLGSLLTLLVTSNVTIPFVSESSPAATLAQAETSTDLSAKDAFIEQPQNDAMRYADLDAELRDALNEATEERAQLASTLVQLTRQIEVLESDAINRESRDALQSGVTDDTGDVTQEALSGAGSEGGAERSRAQRRIDSLVAAGIDVQERAGHTSPAGSIPAGKAGVDRPGRTGKLGRHRSVLRAHVACGRAATGSCVVSWVMRVMIATCTSQVATIASWCQRSFPAQWQRAAGLQPKDTLVFLCERANFLDS